jgi:hypothetical protein
MREIEPRAWGKTLSADTAVLTLNCSSVSVCNHTATTDYAGQPFGYRYEIRQSPLMTWGVFRPLAPRVRTVKRLCATAVGDNGVGCRIRMK